jgi:hypothetical protein
MRCTHCNGPIVLIWKGHYTARVECHGCFLRWSIGLDPCYKEVEGDKISARDDSGSSRTRDGCSIGEAGTNRS